MQFSVSDTALRVIPVRVMLRHGERINAALDQIDGIIAGRDDRAMSQRTALFAFSIRIVSALIAYVSQVLLARWMGEYEYGIFVVVWVGAVILGGLACFGFQTLVIRMVPEYQSKGSLSELRGIVFASRFYSMATATLIAVFGVAGTYYFQHALQNYYILPFYLAAICLPMLALSEVQDGVARAFNWPHVALTPTFLVRPILILLTMGVALYWGFAASATTALAATIIATWLATLWQLLLLKRRLDNTIPAGKKVTHPLMWASIAVPIFLVEGFFNLLTNVDILMVGHFMEPEKTGVYFATVKTLALVHFVYFAVKAGAAHRFAQYKSSGDTVAYHSFIADTIKWTFWPSLAMCILLLAVGKYLLLLFGANFASGYPLLFVLVVGLVARAAVGPAESVLTMSGEQNVCAAIYAITLIVNIVLNLTFIPQYGLYGAAMATSAALVFEAIALYAITLRRLNVHMFIFPRHPRAKEVQS